MVSFTENSESKGKLAKTSVRIFLSAALLYFAYSSVNSSEVIAILSSLSIRTFFILSALYFVGQIISAWKWTILFRSNAIERSFREAVQAYFLGMFVNTFGLGTVGGDVVRALALKPKQGLRTNALGSVIADRVHGLSVLGIIGSVFILIFQPKVLGILGIVGAIAFILCSLIFWFFGPSILKSAFINSQRFSSIASRLSNGFPRDLPTLGRISIISVVFHVLQIFMVHFTILELNASVELGYLFATIPIINILSALPLSINGLGIREWAYVFMFTAVGVDKEICLAIAAVWIIVITIVSALGGAAVVISGKKPQDIGLNAPV